MEHTGRRLDLEHGVSKEMSVSSARPEYPIELVGAASVLEEGQVSRPIATDRGYYVIKVLERVPPDTERFERISSTLAGNLIDTKQRRIVEEWMLALRENAKVTDYRSEAYQ